MKRVRIGLLAGVALGSLALVGCTPKGTPPDTSAIGEGVADIQGTRWTANPVATAQNVSGWHSYDGIAYGPGSAYPQTRYTLRNPAPHDEYLPALDNPMFGAISEVSSETPYKAEPMLVPSDDYYVNGQNMGPSVDRQQAGIPVSGQ